MKKILITRTDRMGDVLLSTPALKAVREAYPESHIAVIVRPYTEECVEDNPYIDEVIVYDKHGIHKNVVDSLRFAMEIRKKGFDMALVLHPTNRMNLTTFLAGIPVRVGYDRKMGFLLTKRIPHKKESGEKHETDYTLDILREIGIKPTTTRPYMSVKRDSAEKIAERLSGMGIRPADRLVAIHPASSCPSKRWPPERFAGVADKLINEYNIKVVLIAGEDGRAFAARTVESMERDAIDLSGKTTISELAALLKRCGLFISNDSGPVHLSVAVGTPVVAIFGRKDKGLSPDRWGPTGERDAILHKDPGCERCRAHNCEKEFICLKAVTEEDVFEAAGKILKTQGGLP